VRTLFGGTGVRRDEWRTPDVVVARGHTAQHMGFANARLAFVARDMVLTQAPRNPGDG